MAEVLLANHDFDLFSGSTKTSKKAAEAVHRLSDFYIQNPGAPTPWQESWCQLAYLSYYLPLNSLRCRAVFQEAARFDFFRETCSVIDFGSGLGSASLELKKFAPHISHFTHIEHATQAAHLHQQLVSPGHQEEWIRQFSKIPKQSEHSMALFSYSLTELTSIPDWLYSLEKLVIIEPASSIQGRRLLEFRQQLIDRGFFMWAPCTHQKACPLLIQSKNDWCHDRIHFEQPEWFQKIEAELPIKNPTLTFSYLVASRQPSPLIHSVKKAARITGDLLREKGKSRQLLCRGPEREYLAWMNRDGEAQEIARGTLVEAPLEYQQKSNEIRLTKSLQEIQAWVDSPST
jgi:hypothetical protein